jgi:SAM-dependent MidA family methyltransferase
MGEAAREMGVRVHGPRPQGEWLAAMGIAARAERLAMAAPERAGEIEAARRRLTAPDEMGSLFKVMALVAEGWPEPAGFA